MRLLRLSPFSKTTILLSIALITSPNVGRPVVADEKPEPASEPRIIKASETVEIVRIAVGLTHVMDLHKAVEERFTKFESEFLFDLSSEIPGVENLTSRISFGQCIGVVLPGFENYVGVALPAEASELLGDEDYELGEDADGNATFGGQKVVKTDRYFSFVELPDEAQFEGLNPIGQQLIDYVSKSESHLILIESDPATIGRSLVKNQLMGYRAVLDTAAQRQDDETDFDYSWRSLTSGHLGKMLELLFRDVEKISFSASHSEPATPFVFEVAVDCRKKSELLSYFQSMKQRRNKALSWLHPNADAFATVSLVLPERIQDQLLSTGRVTAEALQDAAGLNAQAVAQTEGVFRGLAESGAFEVLLQQVPFGEGSACYVGVVPLASGSVFDSELVQLVSSQDSLTTITEIDGWPVYSADGWFDLDLDEGWVPCVVATDSMISVMVFKEADHEKGFALLTELIQREFSPARMGARYGNAMMAAEFSLSDLANFMDSDSSEWESLLPTDLDTSEKSTSVLLDQDQVMWSIGLDGQRVAARFQFEPNALALGIHCFELLITVVSDVADI